MMTIKMFVLKMGLAFEFEPPPKKLSSSGVEPMFVDSLGAPSPFPRSSGGEDMENWYVSRADF